MHYFGIHNALSDAERQYGWRSAKDYLPQLGEPRDVRNLFQNKQSRARMALSFKLGSSQIGILSALGFKETMIS